RARFARPPAGCSDAGPRAVAGQSGRGSMSLVAPTGLSPEMWAQEARDKTVVVLAGPIAPADIPALCRRTRELLVGTQAGLLVCDMGELASPDVAAVDALARLQLLAHRLGRRVRLRRAGGE